MDYPLLSLLWLSFGPLLSCRLGHLYPFYYSFLYGRYGRHYARYVWTRCRTLPMKSILDSASYSRSPRLGDGRQWSRRKRAITTPTKFKLALHPPCFSSLAYLAVHHLTTASSTKLRNSITWHAVLTSPMCITIHSIP